MAEGNGLEEDVAACLHKPYMALLGCPQSRQTEANAKSSREPLERTLGPLPNQEVQVNSLCVFSTSALGLGPPKSEPEISSNFAPVLRITSGTSLVFAR